MGCARRLALLESFVLTDPITASLEGDSKVTCMMQPRQISRELALLTASQFSAKSKQFKAGQLEELIIAATRTLVAEIKDVLEVASSELERGNSCLLRSETRSTDVNGAVAMVQEAIVLSQKAINRMGTVVDIPEFIENAKREDVYQYALHILETLLQKQELIDQRLNQSMVEWSMSRLARVDQDILTHCCN